MHVMYVTSTAILFRFKACVGGSNPPLVFAPVVGYGKPAEHVRVLYCKQIIGSNPVGAIM